MVSQLINTTRNSVAGSSDHSQCRVRERFARTSTSPCQSIVDVIQRPSVIKCGKVDVSTDSLIERFQTWLCQFFFQRQLTNKDKSHKWFSEFGKIGKNPQFFNQTIGQLMCFITNENQCFTSGL